LLALARVRLQRPNRTTRSNSASKTVDSHIYPGEGHGVMKYKNRKAKMEWDLAWFDRYIMGKK
jgi:dipeptidyl aminopeptidase/acylaminoacyl peptidase